MDERAIEERMYEMADMATLIRQEESRLFGQQTQKIVGLAEQFKCGTLTHSEFLAAVAATYAQ